MGVSVGATSLSSNHFPVLPGCVDSDWLGSDGFDCEAWTPTECLKDGDVIKDENGVTANDGCCVCGGGTARQCLLVVVLLCWCCYVVFWVERGSVRTCCGDDWLYFCSFSFSFLSFFLPSLFCFVRVCLSCLRPCPCPYACSCPWRWRRRFVRVRQGLLEQYARRHRGHVSQQSDRRLHKLPGTVRSVA